MTEITLLAFLHLLLFVYWLGADLGVFHSSKYVVDPNISVESRQVAARIMFWLDQTPKMCMPLILPAGIHLASALGYITLSGLQVGLIWLVCVLWLFNVHFIHILKPGGLKHGLERLDFWFRIVLMSGLILFSLYSLVSGGPDSNDMVAVKLLVFALLVGCGLLIRLFLRPFIPAFVELTKNGPSEAGNQIMIDSLRRCRYVVMALWVGLLFNAAVGVGLITF
ncbi:MAG: hypothetical protein ACR2P9_04735 [Gammaproteobacteria bacterium]